MLARFLRWLRLRREMKRLDQMCSDRDDLLEEIEYAQGIAVRFGFDIALQRMRIRHLTQESKNEHLRKANGRSA